VETGTGDKDSSTGKVVPVYVMKASSTGSRCVVPSTRS
jgi:hypothetical protein